MGPVRVRDPNLRSQGELSNRPSSRVDEGFRLGAVQGISLDPHAGAMVIAASFSGRRRDRIIHLIRLLEDASEELLIQQSIARRYARALFESVGSDYERAGRELAVVAGAFEESPDAVALFTSPQIESSVRSATIEQIIAAGNLHPMVANTLRLLNDRDRLAEVPMLARMFGELVDEKVGRVRATLTSAEPLPESVVRRIEAALGEATNKQVAVTTELDRSILGGVVARVGNVVYDGSLRTQLESLRRELTSRA